MPQHQEQRGSGNQHEFVTGDYEVTERLFGLIWRVAVIGLMLVVLTPVARFGG